MSVTGTSFTQNERQWMYTQAGDLISTYFIKSEQIGFQRLDLPVSSSQKTKSCDEIEMFYRSLRISIILGHLQELTQIVEGILLKTEVKRERMLITSQGGIKGTLDIPRYIVNKHLKNTKANYPCIVITKNNYNIENVFFYFVISSVYNELSALPDEGMLEGSPEEQVIQQCFEWFSVLLKDADYSECIDSALDLLHADLSDIDVMITKVFELFDYGTATNPYYLMLVKWYKKFSKQKIEPFGNNSALVYDTSFDHTLYEIWLLHGLSATIIKEFNFKLVEQPSPLYLRDKGPIYTLVGPNNQKIKLFFRKGSGLLWKGNEEGTSWKNLRGFPDIILQYEYDGKDFPLVLIDAKDRKRESHDVSEEIYKMIGYFDNFSRFTKTINGPIGVLIFRSKTEKWKRETMHNESGSILSLSCDPQSQENYQSAFTEICEHIFQQLGVLQLEEDSLQKSIRDIKNSNIVDLNLLENELEQSVSIVETAIHERVLMAVAGRKTDLDYTKRDLENNHFFGIWDKLESDTKDFISMGELIYHDLKGTLNADFAPSCIEYCRALEKELNEKVVKVYKEQATLRGVDLRTTRYLKLPKLTLGQLKDEIIISTQPNNRDHFADFAIFLSSCANSKFLTETLIRSVTELNTMYRRKAAHTDKITEIMVQDCRARVLGIGVYNKLIVNLLNSI